MFLIWPPMTETGLNCGPQAVFDERSLRCLVEVMGPERVMLGSDYPFPLGEQRIGSLVRGRVRRQCTCALLYIISFFLFFSSCRFGICSSFSSSREFIKRKFCFFIWEVRDDNCKFPVLSMCFLHLQLLHSLIIRSYPNRGAPILELT